MTIRFPIPSRYTLVNRISAACLVARELPQRLAIRVQAESPALMAGSPEGKNLRAQSHEVARLGPAAPAKFPAPMAVPHVRLQAPHNYDLILAAPNSMDFAAP